MVVLTGTDLYRDERFGEDAKESLELARCGPCCRSRRWRTSPRATG
jgi:hypothetical protein